MITTVLASFVDDNAVMAALPALIAGLIAAFIYVPIIIKKTLSVQVTGDKAEKLNEIAGHIQAGASAFLKTEFQYVAIFAVVTSIIISVVRNDFYLIIPFLLGSLLSACAGWLGMYIAVRANVRTTSEAQTSLNSALKLSFRSGSVMGFSVVGLGSVGITVLFLIFGNDAFAGPQYLAAFGFGASSVALFARVAGGTFTKAADVGADLVGKVEAGIPEDDPRNPATIADNVGDNVGDVAGMSADLFESYVGSLIACCALAATVKYNQNLVLGAANLPLVPVIDSFVALPLWLSGLGTISAFIGVFLVQCKDDATNHQLAMALDKGLYGANLIFIAFAALVVFAILDLGKRAWAYFLIVIIGISVGLIIGKITEYYTSYSYHPVKSIARASITGPATVIVQGLSVGMESAVVPTIVIALGIWACTELADTGYAAYSVALAAVGMLGTLAISLATDAFGPIADNAGGIAEMAHLPEEVRDRTDNLDALGNTTAAIGKGFAIGSAVLSAFSLLNVYASAAGFGSSDLLTETKILPGILLGGFIPMFIAGDINLSVNRAATSMIIEVRRQFKEIPGIMTGETPADHVKCVAIATTAALRYMVPPAILAIMTPLSIGFLMGVQALNGFLIGSILSSFLLGIMLNNAGGAWDNAKKYVEAGVDPLLDKKGSDHHSACVVGDTCGDPCKDSSGPALNVLMKLMALLSLTFAPAMATSESNGTWYFGLIIVVVEFAMLTLYKRWLSKSTVSLEDLLADSKGASHDALDEHHSIDEGHRHYQDGEASGDVAPTDAAAEPALSSTEANSSEEVVPQ